MSPTSVTTKLTEFNFREWKTYFHGRLMAKGLYDCLTSETTVANDQKAFGILIETLDPNQYRHIEAATNVQEAYKALKLHHQPITSIDRIEVAKEWTRFNWNHRQETLPDFIHRFQNLTRRLEDVGAPERETNKVTKLLTLMPWDFRHIVDRLSHLPQSEQTVDRVKIALEAEWKAAVRIGAMRGPNGQANEDRALYADNGSKRGGRHGNRNGRRNDGRGRGGYGQPKENGNKKVSCTYCGKNNHLAKDCFKKARDESKNDHSNHADDAFLFSATMELCQQDDN